MRGISENNRKCRLCTLYIWRGGYRGVRGGYRGVRGGYRGVRGLYHLKSPGAIMYTLYYSESLFHLDWH